jgi:hypothetical protein
LKATSGTFAFGFLAVAVVAAGGALVVTRRSTIATPRPALAPVGMPA